ncbi:MAG: hypothetical protein ACOZQL_11675 [Myxococcota bacterium]
MSAATSEDRRRAWLQALLIVWVAFAVLAGSLIPAFSDQLIRLCGG